MKQSKPEGRAHRALLRQVIVPTLKPGSSVPCGAALSKLLGINKSEAIRHMRRVLAEDGIVTEMRRLGGREGARTYIHINPVFSVRQ